MERNRRLLLPLVLLFLLLPQAGQAQERFLATATPFNMTRLLAPPPAVGSPQQQEEMATLLALQKSRTPEQVALAQADADRTVFRFADAIGPAFSAANLPETGLFFEKIRHTADAMIGSAKKDWDRPRPYVTYPALTPCLPKPHNASYPSGHATFGTVTSIVLATMLPEYRDTIFARAAVYRFNRELGGVHYPSDVEAGRICGTVVAALLFQDPEFLAAYGKVAAQTRQVLGLPPVYRPSQGSTSSAQ